MHYELITAEEYEGLPEEPEAQFVEIEQICRRSMNQMIDENTSGSFDNLVRAQYMTTVAAAAEELGVPGVNYPHGADNPGNGINEFLLEVSGVVTRIRLRKTRLNRPLSVQLSARTRGRIELQIQKLRHIISDAAMDDRRRENLLGKLDALSTELNKPRLGFGPTMAILAAVGVGVATGISFLADAPAALATITSLIGQDKEAEEAERLRLGPPPVPKALDVTP